MFVSKLGLPEWFFPAVLLLLLSLYGGDHV